MKIKTKILITFISAMVISSHVMALAPGYESKSGVVDYVSVFGEGNYAFRVKFKGRPAMCSNGESWAYVESIDTNYKTKVSALLTAFSTGVNVSLYTKLSDRNHCQLMDITGMSK